MFPHIFGSKGYGRLTQAAGTKIVRLIEPCEGFFTSVAYAQIITSTTAHILTALHPLGKTTLSAAAATGQAVVNLTADPGNYVGWGTADNLIATGDFCAVECDDGLIHFGTVTMSTLEATFAGNLPCAASAGNRFWTFGVETDTNPYDGLVHARYTLTASVTNKIGNDNEGIEPIKSVRRSEPILLIIDNGTAASTLERVTAAYSVKANRFWSRITDDATFTNPTIA